MENMKKIFIAVLLSSIFIFNVNALTNDLNIIKSETYICDNGVKYPIFEIRDTEKDYYFLTMDMGHNFDFRDYEEYSFDMAPYSERVRGFTYYKNWFMDLPYYYAYYKPFVSLMIYRYLTGNNDLFLCDNNLNEIILDEKYEENYQKILHMIEGLSFEDYIKILPNQDYDFVDSNMSYYLVEGLDSVNGIRPNDNIVRINADKGLYTLVFHSNYEEDLGSLYSDHYDYILEEGTPVSYEKVVTVEIADPILKIHNSSDENIDFTSLCFNIVGKDGVHHFCSNEEGEAIVSAPVGIYHLEILSDINNNYSGNQVALKSISQDIYIRWGENETPVDDNSVGFIPSDTLELSGLLVLIISTIGIGYAIKKTY